MKRSKEEVLGAIQSMIGPIGHLSNPNATEPFKRAIYSALMVIYDSIKDEGQPSTEAAAVDLTPILNELQDLKEEIKAIKDRREIFEGKVKRIEATLKAGTPPK